MIQSMSCRSQCVVVCVCQKETLPFSVVSSTFAKLLRLYSALPFTRLRLHALHPVRGLRSRLIRA